MQEATAVSPEEDGWEPIAPSAVPFDPRHPAPHEMTAEDMDRVRAQLVAAARRSLAAGYEVVEIHAAHGYLLHQFLSPLSNVRADQFGGSLANRPRYPLSVAGAVREAWPAQRPVFGRVSATDQATGLPTAAVGLITEPWQAETILASGQADAVLLGREFLRDPYWPMRAARSLCAGVAWPPQHERAR